MSLVTRIKNWDSHHRLFVAAGLALLVGVATRGRMSLPTRMAVIWDVFAGTALVLAWLRIVTACPREALKSARLQDSSRTTIFLFVLFGALASIFAVAHLLGTAHARHGEMLLETTGLAFGTLVGSWSLIHTLFTLRYAHLYYGDADGSAKSPGHRGGLDFPGELMPDYLDFAYVSFVIGMTGQVSDVQISDRSMRRLALVHGWLAFGFNTIILAISINIASGLFS